MPLSIAVLRAIESLGGKELAKLLFPDWYWEMQWIISEEEGPQ